MAKAGPPHRGAAPTGQIPGQIPGQIAGPRIMAHRGGPGLPGNDGIENTLAAFGRAVTAGFDLETDVRASSDGVAVLHHDPDLRRTAGDDRRIGDLPWSVLRGVRIGGREPPARLDDLLDAHPAVAINLDVKDRRAVTATVQAIRRAGATGPLTLASFSPLRAARVRRALGADVGWSGTPVEIAVLVGAARTRSAGARGIARRVARGVGCLQVPVGLATGADGPRLIRLAHLLGIEVHVWTVDEVSLARELLGRGVDALISDRPQVVAEVLAGGPWSR